MKRKKCNPEAGFCIFQSGEENNSGLFLLPNCAKSVNETDFLEMIGRLRINPVIGEKIAISLDLTYLDDEEIEGNLCMANIEEVLPEFREICTNKDIRNYVSSILRTSDFEKIKNYGTTRIKIPFPENSKTFWTFVEEDRQRYN